MSIFIIHTIFSCGSWKSGLEKTGDKNSARMNIIIDFAHKYPSDKKKSYLIDDYTETENFYVFILSKFKSAPRLSDTIGSYTNTFPTNFHEIDNELFFWFDKSKPLDVKMIDVMSKYDAIDSTFIKDNNGYILVSNKREDVSKNIFYFVCKENISTYKRIKEIWVREENYPKGEVCSKSKI